VIAAIIQARMGSTRLPEKVMMEISGKPVLWHVINRVKHASLIDYIIVATTQEKIDDHIERACKSWGIPVFRGSTDDVLARYFKTIRYIESTIGAIRYIVRITADCPLIDPRIVDDIVQDAKSGHYDYVSNVDPPTYPDGFDVEVIAIDAIEDAYFNATLASEREHVTPYIRNNPHFKKFNHLNIANLSDIRLTLDTMKDFLLINQIYQRLYHSEEVFFLQDVLRLLENQPSLLEINSEHKRHEGFRKSLMF